MALASVSKRCWRWSDKWPVSGAFICCAVQTAPCTPAWPWMWRSACCNTMASALGDPNTPGDGARCSWSGRRARKIAVAPSNARRRSSGCNAVINCVLFSANDALPAPTEPAHTFCLQRMIYAFCRSSIVCCSSSHFSSSCSAAALSSPSLLTNCASSTLRPSL